MQPSGTDSAVSSTSSSRLGQRSPSARATSSWARSTNRTSSSQSSTMNASSSSARRKVEVNEDPVEAGTPSQHSTWASELTPRNPTRAPMASLSSSSAPPRAPTRSASWRYVSSRPSATTATASPRNCALGAAANPGRHQPATAALQFSITLISPASFAALSQLRRGDGNLRKPDNQMSVPTTPEKEQDGDADT